HVDNRCDLFDLDERGCRSDRVDVALIELAKPAAGRPMGAQYGRNLIPLEKLWQLALMLGDNARERDGQVVPEREIRLTAGFVLDAAQDLENELIAFLAVLAE